MKTKLIAFALAALLSAGALAGVSKFTVGKYTVYYNPEETKAVVCTVVPMNHS